MLHGHPDFAAIEAGQIDMDVHARLMAKMGAFYASLDPVIGSACGALGDDIAGYRYRPRLDLFPAKSDRRIPIPKIATPGALAGAIYVVDGAVLGGQVLARALGDRPLHPYWTWCCQNGASVWRAAQTLIDHVDTDQRARDTATRAALDVFGSFARALDMSGTRRA